MEKVEARRGRAEREGWRAGLTRRQALEHRAALGRPVLDHPKPERLRIGVPDPLQFRRERTDAAATRTVATVVAAGVISCSGFTQNMI